MSIQFSQCEKCYADIALTYSTIVKWSQRVFPFFIVCHCKTCRYIILELSSPGDLASTSPRDCSDTSIEILKEDHNFLVKDTRMKEREREERGTSRVYSNMISKRMLWIWLLSSLDCAKSLAKEHFYARKQTDFNNMSSLYMSSPTQFSSLKCISSRMRCVYFFMQ